MSRRVLARGLAELLAETLAAPVVVCWACKRAELPFESFAEDARGSDRQERRVCPSCATDPHRFKPRRGVKASRQPPDAAPKGALTSRQTP